jgi:hypothetical protein
MTEEEQKKFTKLKHQNIGLLALLVNCKFLVQKYKNELEEKTKELTNLEKDLLDILKDNNLIN